MRLIATRARAVWACVATAGLTALIAWGCRAKDSPPAARAADDGLTAKQALGKALFFDTGLSHPKGKSCGSCHAPGAGFADPDSSVPVSKGAIEKRFGNRNTPTVACAAYSPEFHWDKQEQMYVGGQFWDGRASTLAEQVKGPFLNPLEMQNTSKAQVVAAVGAGRHAELFRRVYGDDALAARNTEQAFEQIAEAIAVYERTTEVSPFTSKYDYYLKGQATLDAREQSGLKLFLDPKKGNCAACHPTGSAADVPGPLFTDFTYDNLGIPKNPRSPYYDLPPSLNPAGKKFVDLGLGSVVNDAKQNGKFKVPTLRNVAVTPPYAHNGAFRTLREILDFYNTRDVPGRSWPPAEVKENINRSELGNLGLTDAEIDDLLAFLETLTDGYRDVNARE